MRVIEPHMFRGKRSRRSHRAIGAAIVALSVLLIIFVVLMRPQKPAATMEGVVSSEAASSSAVAGVSSERNALKFFTGEQFQNLYDSLALPNTEPLNTPPTITGNQAADVRIRQIAESRGYTLRSVPVFPIAKTEAPGLVEDDLLQPKALIAWKELLALAQKENIPLKLNSGYRSIDMQRQLFMSRLAANPTDIAAGRADPLVIKVLSQAAPPGYSRHHTGYTIDLICNDGSGRQFKATGCFTWLKNNNYQKAKQTGWLPSYPEGVSKQGPEPESWEYVWVGLDAVYN